MTTSAVEGGNPAINTPTNVTFKITDTTLYLPLVTLTTENDTELLEQLKTGFKRTIKWNKYRSEMSNQTKNNNLHYLIDYLSYHLKMSMRELLFQSIIHQKLK